MVARVFPKIILLTEILKEKNMDGPNKSKDAEMRFVRRYLQL